MNRFALVTKTFRGDMAAFMDLCDSIDNFMPETDHYVLVDDADEPVFLDFTSPHRTIVNVTQLLPALREISVIGKRVWWDGRTRLIRGWIYQQMAKIAFVAQMEEDAAVHLDSDVCLLQPIAYDDVFDGDKVVLRHSPGGGQSERHTKWHRLAQIDLGLPISGYQGQDYIGPATIWSAPVARAMIERLEQVNNQSWTETLARHWRFSEYLHYGVFCDQAPGDQRSSIVHRKTGDCHVCWGYELEIASERDRFVGDLRADHRSVLIQSNLKLAEPVRAQLLERVRARSAQLAKPRL